MARSGRSSRGAERIRVLAALLVVALSSLLGGCEVMYVLRALSLKDFLPEKYEKVGNYSAPTQQLRKDDIVFEAVPYNTPDRLKDTSFAICLWTTWEADEKGRSIKGHRILIDLASVELVRESGERVRPSGYSSKHFCSGPTADLSAEVFHPLDRQSLQSPRPFEQGGRFGPHLLLRFDTSVPPSNERFVLDMGALNNDGASIPMPKLAFRETKDGDADRFRVTRMIDL